MPWHVETSLLSQAPSHVCRTKQLHGDTIMWAEDVTPATVGDGTVLRKSSSLSSLIRTADCLPLVLETSECACNLHVSRKSLVAGLLDRVPEFVSVSDIQRVHIGPHICEEHFVFETLGPEIVAFSHAFPEACRESQEGLHLSLVKAVETYMRTWKVSPALVVRDSRCTFEVDTLPSYRRVIMNKLPLTDHVATVVRWD